MRKELLKKLHACEIEILDVIVSICERNGLNYFLIGGTLLGAARHKGFIPWDDDLDIAMPRNDYESFKLIAIEELANTEFYYIDMDDKDYLHPFAKVCKKNTSFEEVRGRKQGIFVDIFPLDSSNKRNNNKQKRVLNYLCNLMYMSSTNYAIICKFIPRNILAKIIKRTMTFKNRRKCNYYINLGSQYSINKQTMEKAMYFPIRKMEFEGKKYSVPKETEVILRQIYGDNYMELPPIEKQTTHNPVRLSFNNDGPDEKLG